MAEKMLAGDIKEGDSVIVDVDSDGNVIVLNGSSGSPESLPDVLSIVLLDRSARILERYLLGASWSSFQPCMVPNVALSMLSLPDESSADELRRSSPLLLLG
ncbi:hypothetical protein GH714_024989 [Hevea brasiliensis]|uniref:Uncharacterized protein n=1 Tax=Hevea brasiliensis TaxID=3981 RepID=A0A6A6MD37_HEVBR|nr:hypothetical protein GH714_024989 [Hevea brasiliensis]